MKFYSLITVFAMLFSFSALAQNKKNTTAVISTPSVQCGMCKTRIENYLKREDGIVSSKVDIKKKTTTVTWINDRTNIENIKTAIANVGYDADDVTAEETAYNKLPKCCKKPAETKKPDQ